MCEDRLNLVHRIQVEFPDLAISRSRLIGKGDDHAVMVINERLIFRFPRGPVYQKAFVDELKLVAALKGASPIPVPDYTFVARDRSFGGYELIPGKEMTTGRFRRLTKAQKRRIAAALGRFLGKLHRLDRRLLPAYRAREPWSGTDLEAWRKHYWNDQRAVLAPYLGRETLAGIDAFYERYVRTYGRFPVSAIIHGDLTDDHVLLDQRRGRIGGVIDFADAAIGDPAQDFSFLWTYGDWAAKHACERYDAYQDDGLLERSRWHYLRYATHRVCYCLRHSMPETAAFTAKRLRRQLHAIA